MTRKLYIHGLIQVLVSPVDLEQAIIEYPRECEGFTDSVQVMIAATKKKDYVDFLKVLKRNGLTLHWNISQMFGEDWLVSFSTVHDHGQGEYA